MSGIPLVITYGNEAFGVFEFLTAGDASRGADPPTHIAFPLAEAESLIDPNDPAVREDAVVAAAVQMVANRTPGEVVDAVLAALRGAK